MKIPSYLKTPGLFLCFAFPVALSSNRCTIDRINDIKTKVASKDSLRYKRVEKETNGYDNVTKRRVWEKELSDMNDSLRVDSIVKQAYFEGAQMVRDSINNLK